MEWGIARPNCCGWKWCGPDFSESGSKREPGYPYIFYVRNAKPHKNVSRLLKAFSIMENRDIKLVLSGKADVETQNEALRLGVSDRIIYSGRISEEELPVYYRSASLVIMPSLYEGFGLPALEGMASGIPVVVSNTTSLPEVVGDAGILVDPYDPTSIAEGLDRGLSDTVLRLTLRDKGLRRAKMFTWENVALRVGQVLEI